MALFQQMCLTKNEFPNKALVGEKNCFGIILIIMEVVGLLVQQLGKAIGN